VAPIAVVGDGQDVAAVDGVAAVGLQALPQLAGGGGLEVADRELGDAAGAEDDVAVQVREHARAGPLVGDEAGEAAGGAAIVGDLGGLLDALPDGAGSRRAVERAGAAEVVPAGRVVAVEAEAEGDEGGGGAGA